MSFIKLEYTDGIIKYISTTSNIEFVILPESTIFGNGLTGKYNLIMQRINHDVKITAIGKWLFDEIKEAIEFTEKLIKTQIIPSVNNTTSDQLNKQLLEKIDELIECIKYLPITEIAGSEFKTAQFDAIERGFKP